MRPFLVIAAVSATVMSATAVQVDVADSGNVVVASGDVVSPATVAAPDTLPAVGSGPIFHLDASQTNGWTFGTSGTSVRKIP